MTRVVTCPVCQKTDAALCPSKFRKLQNKFLLTKSDFSFSDVLAGWLGRHLCSGARCDWTALRVELRGTGCADG